jgi:mannose-6-phosphate isomerase-like protein (cupin superfamily)
MAIPLSGELDAELKVGDVIRVPPGDYVLENPTTKPLDFLSIEVKH